MPTAQWPKCVDESDFVGKARNSYFCDQNLEAGSQAQNTSKNDDLKNGLGKLFKINSRINYLHVLVTKT